MERNISKKDNNKIFKFFIGDGTLKNPSHLDFETWYHPDVSHYLLQMSDNNAQAIRVLFADEEHCINYKADYGYNTDTFIKNVQALASLCKLMGRNAMFIAKEPGCWNHIICGLIHNNDLLLIDPLGEYSPICFTTLARLKELDILKNIWLSSVCIQSPEIENEGLVSCGPITLELVSHFLTNFTEQKINELWAEKLNADIAFPEVENSTNLVYFQIKIENFLPRSLLNIISLHNNKHAYQTEIKKLRLNHLKKLEKNSTVLAEAQSLTVEKYLEQCQNEALSQIVFNFVLQELDAKLNQQTQGRLTDLEEYNLLEKELSLPVILLEDKINWNADLNLSSVDNTPFWLLTLENRAYENFKLLVEQGIVIDFRNGYGLQGLKCAILVKRPDVLQLLIDNAVNPEWQDWKEAITFALSFEQELCADILVDAATDINIGLRNSARLCKWNSVRLFLNKGAEVDSKFGDEALKCAINTGEFDIVKLLITKGANVNVGLTLAAKACKWDIVRFFLDNTELSPGDLEEPLRFAMKVRKLDIIILMLQCGANANTVYNPLLDSERYKDDDETKEISLLRLATEEDSEELIQLIKESDLKVKRVSPLIFNKKNKSRSLTSLNNLSPKTINLNNF